MARGPVEFSGNFFEGLCVFGHGALLLVDRCGRDTGVTPVVLWREPPHPRAQALDRPGVVVITDDDVGASPGVEAAVAGSKSALR
jgi:hypothetical protein